MRQNEVRFLDCNFVICDYVEGNRARAPTLFRRAVSAERALHCVRARQKIARRERRVNRDAEVHERRLLGPATGRRYKDRRARNERDVVALAQLLDGLSEQRAAVADIAAEREPGERHRCALRVRVRITPTSLKVAAIGACGLWMVTVTLRTRGNSASTASATLPPAASIRRKRWRTNAFDAHVTTLSYDTVSVTLSLRAAADRSISSTMSRENVCPTLASCGITP